MGGRVTLPRRESWFEKSGSSVLPHASRFEITPKKITAAPTVYNINLSNGTYLRRVMFRERVAASDRWFALDTAPSLLNSREWKKWFLQIESSVVR